MKNKKCPHCEQALILPTKNPKSPILLVNSIPVKEHFAGDRFPFPEREREILGHELRLAGWDFYRTQRTIFWKHRIPKAKDENRESCRLFMLESFIKEAKNKQLILLFGKEVVKELTGHSIRNTYGLKVDCSFIESSKIVRIAPKVSEAFEGGVGELRLSVTKFVNELKKAKLI